jgi:uncharacterized protein (TIGR03437 family)
LIQKPVILFLAFAATLSAAPQLVLSTTSVGPIHVIPGTNGATQTVQARNAGTGSLNLSAAASATWLAATVGATQACTGATGSCNPIGIALNTAALTAGLYTGYVTVTDPNAVDTPQQITVTVNVAGIPGSLSLYVVPTGAADSSTSALIFTQAAVTAKVTTQSGGNWLAFITGGIGFVGCSSGYCEYGIQATAQKGQATGSYTGTVALTGANPADNKTIDVTLNVTNSPIIEPIATPVQLSGFPGGANATATVSFNNIGSGTLDITAATASSSTGSFLSASVSSPDTIVLTAAPGTLASGYYSGTVTLTSNAANNSQISVPVVFTAEAAGTPLIYSLGVVNIANFTADAATAPGEILAAFGDQLAPTGTFAQNPGAPPLATTLGTVQVLVNGVPAPLYFVSPTQVNFQLPYEASTGQVTTVQVVSNGTPGNTRPVNVTASVPRVLIWQASFIAGSYGIVVNNQDGSLVVPGAVAGYATHPAKPGDTITIYCTGLGETIPAAVTGAAASSSTLEAIQNVTVTFGGGFIGNPVTASTIFAGLTPTAVGLYQVDVTIPANVPIGAAVPVTVNLNGASSNPGNIAVSQ